MLKKNLYKIELILKTIYFYYNFYKYVKELY